MVFAGACTPGLVFSKATAAVGWCAVVFAALFMAYSAYRMVCCCSRRPKLPAGRGSCDVPFAASPLVAFIGSLRFTYGRGHPAALHVGDGCLVHAYDEPRLGKVLATPVLLRLGATELDAPAPSTWQSTLTGRTHAGHFVVSATAGEGRFSLSSADGRALNWKLAAPNSAYSSAFPAALLVRGSPKDAPDLERGFASKPLRRVAVALLVEGLGAYAAAAVEVSPAEAAWEAACRSWWARALTRSLSAAVLVATFEYTFTAVLPVAVERVQRKVFLSAACMLLLPLAALALWGLIVNAVAGDDALRSSFVVYGCALGWLHVVLWPLLLLLSAGLWRDIPVHREPPPPRHPPTFGSTADVGAKEEWAAMPLPLQPPPDDPWAASGRETDNPWARV